MSQNIINIISILFYEQNVINHYIGKCIKTLEISWVIPIKYKRCDYNTTFSFFL